MSSFPGWINQGGSGSGSVDVPIYAYASLPTPKAGLIVKLSDFNRGLWYANGTNWLPVGDKVIFDPVNFGADPTGTNDSSTAINLAITSMSPASVNAIGYALNFSPGIYRLSAPIDIVRRIIMDGANPMTNQGAPSVYLLPDVGVTSIIVHYYQDGSADGGDGSWSQIKNIVIEGSAAPSWSATHVTAINSYIQPNGYSQYVFQATSVSGDTKTGSVEPTWPATKYQAVSGGSNGTTVVDNHVTWTARYRPAIYDRGRATIENVTILGVSGDGLAVVADTNATPPTNANNMRVDEMFISGINGNGVYIQGGDSNAGTFTGIGVGHYLGWGVWDGSFLGNAHLGHSVDPDGSALGAYQSDNANAATLFVGCYSESVSSRILTPAQMIGGIAAGFITSDSTGLAVGGNISSPTIMQSQGTTGGKDASLWIGANDQSGPVALRLRLLSSGSVVAGSDFILGYGANFGWGMFPVGSSPGNGVWGISDTTLPYSTGGLASGTAGLLLAPRGISFYTNNVNTLTSMTSVPSTGTWAVGDLVLNQGPTAGSRLGWRCITAGTPGTWETLYANNSANGSVESVLASVVVNSALTTKQTLYTVPSGQSCIITKAISRSLSSSSSLGAAGFGFDANASNVLPAAALGVSGTYVMQTPTGTHATAPVMGNAGDVFGLKMTVTDTITYTVDTFGYLI